MHNSENQEATANCKNVVSPHSFLSIFRCTMMMVLSIVGIRDYMVQDPDQHEVHLISTIMKTRLG